MRFLVCVLAGVTMGVAACAAQQSSSASSARTVGTQLARAGGGYDAEIAMPAGFPSDVPVYPKARLTAAASFSSNGVSTWGMEWETADPVDRVAAFYDKLFNQGDWALRVTSSTAGSSWVGRISRKGNSRIQGTITVNGDQNVNRILLSLVYPA